MFEAASLHERSAMEHPRSHFICAHCGQDSRLKNYGWWPKGGAPRLACCETRLVEGGADPHDIIEQDPRPLWR